MNAHEYDVMNILSQSPYQNQRLLSEKSKYSLGKINNSLKVLQANGYLNKDMQLTEQANKEISAKKPRNAIILAAGSGMRMVPIHSEIPKGLLEIRNETLIERLIKQLHQVGLKNITVVVGFMKEQFEFLIDKYNINLAFAPDYMTKNNLHSLASVVKDLGNTYIIPSDLWCAENPFSETELYSWYMVGEIFSEDSIVRINRKRELVLIKNGEDGNQMFGISYILNDLAEIMKPRINDLITNPEFKNAFWEEAVVENGKMLLFPKEVTKDSVFEINTLEELRSLDENSDQLHSDIISLIAQKLHCSENEVSNIEPLKKGMTNRSFMFTCKGKRYIMRVPGEGTEEMLNRKQEGKVYEVLASKNICDKVIYFSSDKGYKITEFLEGFHNCDDTNFDEVARCMKAVRAFHDLDLKVPHSFDIFKNIESYELFWNGAPSIYRDYTETKKKMYELKEYIEKQPRQISLTHIDANCDNILLSDDDIYLIDWEYAGMQDVHVDIAMFAIYSMYDHDNIDKLIDLYFEGDCPYEVRTKIYCYIAVCGFLWSNWCEYKRNLGIEFGEYSLRQYRYAKDYYKLAKERMNCRVDKC